MVVPRRTLEQMRNEIKLRSQAPPFWFAGAKYKDLTEFVLREILQARNLSHVGISKLKELCHRLIKADHRPYHFEGLTLEQQWSLAYAMGIDAYALGTDRPRGTYVTPVSALYRAEEARTFHRFQDLPPELRNKIYTDGFDDLVKSGSQGMVRPRQPAITRTSREIREESLGLFYATQTFVIHTIGMPKKMDPRCPRQATNPNMPTNPRDIVAKDKQWLASIGDTNRANIQSIMVARFSDEIHFRNLASPLQINVTVLEWEKYGNDVVAKFVGLYRRDVKAQGGLIKAEKAMAESGKMWQAKTVQTKGFVEEALKIAEEDEEEESSLQGKVVCKVDKVLEAINSMPRR